MAIPEALTSDSVPVRPFLPPDQLPLRGVTVLDMSRYLAAPFAASILGDLGAEVVKLEALDRDDPGSHTAPLMDGTSVYYLATVRNKRAIGLDLKKPEGYEIFRKLCLRSDVIVENYRRDVPQSLRVDYPSVSAIKKDIILCSVRSFSAESSMKDRPAYDAAVQAYTGLMSVTGQEDGEVARAGVAVADLSTGLYATIGILAALQKARASGEGTHIEIALADTGLAYMTLQLSTFLNTGQLIRRSGTEHPAMAPLRVFHTATADLLVMASKTEEYSRLCEAISRPELIDDASYRTNALRVQNRTELHAVIADALAEKTAEQWQEIFDNARVPCTRVRDAEDITTDPDFRATMMSAHLHKSLGEVKLVRNPLTLDGGSLPFRTMAPGWAEQTDEILAELGFSPEEIMRLRDNGVVGANDPGMRGHGGGKE
jgi:crotonobetainyl-CoA:carnitine CoA-transferase CaiB-like acyl-CoA transferase